MSATCRAHVGHMSGTCRAHVDRLLLVLYPVGVAGLVRTLSIKEIWSTYMTLTWECPEDDGGQPIGYYIVEYMDLKSGTWIKAGEIRISRE